LLAAKVVFLRHLIRLHSPPYPLFTYADEGWNEINAFDRLGNFQNSDSGTNRGNLEQSHIGFKPAHPQEDDA